MIRSVLSLGSKNFLKKNENEATRAKIHAPLFGQNFQKPAVVHMELITWWNAKVFDISPILSFYGYTDKSKGLIGPLLIEAPLTKMWLYFLCNLFICIILEPNQCYCLKVIPRRAVKLMFSRSLTSHSRCCVVRIKRDHHTRCNVATFYRQSLEATVTTVLCILRNNVNGMLNFKRTLVPQPLLV